MLPSKKVVLRPDLSKFFDQSLKTTRVSLGTGIQRNAKPMMSLRPIRETTTRGSVYILDPCREQSPCDSVKF